MRTTNTARRPDLTLEDESKKMICLVDMACPFKPENVNSILSKMRKVVLWESETILRKVTSGLIQSVL